MSVTEASSTTPSRVESRDGGGLADGSIGDALGFVGTGLLPVLVRGLFAPRRWAMKLLTRVDADARAVRVMSAMKRKHGGQGVRLLGGRMVVLWGVDAIREVLDHSADAYAGDSGAKGKGMAHFQPDALTVSRGEEWRDRRAFNDAVLAPSERVHPFGERFVAVVADEVGRLQMGDALTYDDWERMFDHITLRVVFGDAARGDQQLTRLLAKLMAEGNRIVGPAEGDDYHEFYGRLERRIAEAAPESLVARFADAPHSDRTRIVQQVPHWMFATRDTLGANAYRALGAIVAQPAVLQRVREELDSADLSDARAVDGLRYLEGCFSEAMRLWPTTPLLARETTRETTLAGERLDEGTQVMILNPFNHRDSHAVPDADRLEPSRWDGGERDYRFNHLSNGTQDCPGGSLVLLLGKAALAHVLDRYDLTLEQPQLPRSGELPHMLDFFQMRFRAERRG